MQSGYNHSYLVHINNKFMFQKNASITQVEYYWHTCGTSMTMEIRTSKFLESLPNNTGLHFLKKKKQALMAIKISGGPISLRCGPDIIKERETNTSNKHKMLENPTWQEAIQLVIYMVQSWS